MSEKPKNPAPKYTGFLDMEGKRYKIALWANTGKRKEEHEEAGNKDDS